MGTFLQGSFSWNSAWIACSRLHACRSAMRPISNTRRLMAVSLSLVVFSASAIADAPLPFSLNAQFRFFTTSTSIRSISGNNEDVYFTELTTDPEGKAVLLRLVVEYPFLVTPLSYDSSNSATRTAMLIRLDMQRDRAYDKMPLRTAPSDQIALLPIEISFKPHLLSEPDPN